MISRIALLRRRFRPAPTGPGRAASHEGPPAGRPRTGARAAILAAALALLPALPLTAQEATARFGAAQGTPFTVYSTTDIAILRPALEAFTAANPDLSIRYEQWGSNALYAEARKQCRDGAGPADVLFSSAVHQMVELVNSACAQRYSSPRTQALPETRRWRDELWGVTHEPVVTIYNRRLMPPGEAPRTRFELLDLMRRADPRYFGRVATYDIEASGLGYLLAFADSLEATTFGALLEGFARIDAVATCCSAEIIEGVAEGRYLIAYNVLGSYLQPQSTPGLNATVGVILPEDYTLFLSRAYMIPRSAEKPEAAQRLLDYLLGPEGREILRRSGLVFERDPDVQGLPESSERAVEIDPTLLIARDRQRRASFIAQWRSVFGDAEPAP
ncbi:ABC transporter substrate-binding protein [Pseudooceanicola nanhaiensis]|uniref:ABC transporter substrate-binding protein n=1 Tax=Pseudooceanicola nanhaiensis TaxID=375761 RepID=UPI001CD70C4C|nr:ABC transporter substrate-binding protein [Pseudooceanicola nanhaiensis]MCA0922741.1 ABC transporter substrate-binding protein [Pseudooceanicola nanhaiensis]